MSARYGVIIAAMAMVLAAFSASAEEVVLGLSKDQIEITTNFDGSEVLIFGAVKRETPISKVPLDVVITIAGPNQPLAVRKKERRFGIWINTHAVEVDAAPSFYAVNTTAPFDDVISATEDLRHKISIPRAIRSVGAPQDVTDAQSFSDAVIRIRSESGLYQMNEGAVTLDSQTLFRTFVRLPANLTEGGYKTRIFLTRSGEVVYAYETVIDVRKVGLERWLYVLSRDRAMLYGLLSLAIAIAAGWAASAVFTLLRNR